MVNVLIPVKKEKINCGLLILALNAAFFLATPYMPFVVGPNMEKFCQNNKMFIIIVSSLCEIITILCWILNVKFVEFYEEYLKKERLLKGDELIEVKN